LVAKLDRLGRGALDTGATIWRLAACRIEVVVLQLGKLDLTSAAGKMILCVLAAMVEMNANCSMSAPIQGWQGKAKGKTLGRRIKTTARDRTRS
jgi:putative DNA-invertase from lambdoid prophage Rac